MSCSTAVIEIVCHRSPCRIKSIFSINFSEMILKCDFLAGGNMIQLFSSALKIFSNDETYIQSNSFFLKNVSQKAPFRNSTQTKPLRNSLAGMLRNSVAGRLGNIHFS